MTTCNTTFQAARTAMLAALLFVPAFAIESGPLAVMLESKDKLNPGQPVTIVMTMKSAAAIQLATVAVQPSTDWQILDGVSHWTGSMKEGESMELSFRAVPLTAEPATLKVRYHAGTFAEESTSFDPARLGGRAPELVKAGVTLGDPSGGNTAVPQYLFTKLNSVKPELIAEATKNARASAEQFAKDSGQEVGQIRTANQGTIQIDARDPGVSETESPQKTVRVVTTIDYLLGK